MEEIKGSSSEILSEIADDPAPNVVPASDVTEPEAFPGDPKAAHSEELGEAEAGQQILQPQKKIGSETLLLGDTTIGEPQDKQQQEEPVAQPTESSDAESPPSKGAQGDALEPLLEQIFDTCIRSESETKRLIDTVTYLSEELRKSRTKNEEHSVRAAAMAFAPLLDDIDDLAGSPASDLQDLDSICAVLQTKAERAFAESGVLTFSPKIGEPHDRNRHEVMQVTRAESAADDRTIAKVVRRGYERQGQILRPAAVVMSRIEE